ncbi:MAG TPA: hypothetical protein VNN73_05065 [Blastocatellia bacterium]|nr:hypothetical protein [Blastocatellia bacterium]
MKRITLGLIAVSLAFAFACARQETGNVNRNANANVAGAGNQNGYGQVAAGQEKKVTITINDDGAGGCKITVDPSEVKISKKNKDTIKWCVDNTSSAAKDATVTVFDFVDKNDPGKKNPFGDGSPTDNTFDISSDKYDCKVKTKDAAKGEVGVKYEYKVSVKVGGTEKCKLDPQVIIDE